MVLLLSSHARTSKGRVGGWEQEKNCDEFHFTWVQFEQLVALKVFEQAETTFPICYSLNFERADSPAFIL